MVAAVDLSLRSSMAAIVQFDVNLQQLSLAFHVLDRRLGSRAPGMSGFPRHGCFASFCCAWFSSLPNRPIVKYCGGSKAEKVANCQAGEDSSGRIPDRSIMSKASRARAEKVG